VLKLAHTANVLVESFRPGTLESMGLAPEILLEANCSLVLARISGWGQTGPYSERPGFGTLVEGMSGFASMNGFADRDPVLPPIYLGDMTAGLYGAIGILAALRHVEVSRGLGQVIDIPLLDPLFSILGPQAANFRITGKVKPRTGSRSTNSAPRNVYRTGDGRWVCLSASTQAMTERLFRAIAQPALIADPRFATNTKRLENVAQLDTILSDFIGQRNRDECLQFFQKVGVTVGPVYDMSDIEKDPHFLSRKIVVELPDSDLGSVPVHTVSPRLMNTPGGFRRAAPRLGEHTAEVLLEAGISKSEIDALVASQIVLTAPSPGRDT
jgi:crotonobetainyl-CoA:carnitine CoA-transferase CaiB-like acyl-CoA transferase